MSIALNTVIREIEQLPEDAISALAKLVSLIKQRTPSHKKAKTDDLNRLVQSHEHVRKLLSSSKSNWANDIAQEREERL